MKLSKLQKLKEICKKYDSTLDNEERVKLGKELDDFGEKMNERELKEFINDYGKN